MCCTSWMRKDLARPSNTVAWRPATRSLSGRPARRWPPPSCCSSPRRGWWICTPRCSATCPASASPGGHAAGPCPSPQRPQAGRPAGAPDQGSHARVSVRQPELQPAGQCPGGGLRHDLRLAPDEPSPGATRHGPELVSAAAARSAGARRGVRREHPRAGL